MGKTWISRAKRELKTDRPMSVPNSAVMRGDIVDGAVAKGCAPGGGGLAAGVSPDSDDGSNTHGV